MYILHVLDNYLTVKSIATNKLLYKLALSNDTFFSV